MSGKLAPLAAVLVAGCALISCLSGLNAAPSAPAPDADSMRVLKSALARLDAVAPLLDPETRKSLPDLRNIVERVVLHPETATPSEKRIALCFTGTRDIFNDAAKVNAATDIKTQVQQLTTAPISFVPETDQVPGGGEKGLVLLKNPDAAPATVVEIPVGTADYPVERRAELVAQRMEAAHHDDPMWWTKIEVDRYKNEVVVGLPGSSVGYVITADKGFASLRGVSPETLAYDILDSIRATVDPSPVSRVVVPDAQLSPAKRLRRANLDRESGDDAYSAGHKDTAEQDYLRAVMTAPHYAVPYLRLGSLYLEEQEYEKAVQILRQGKKSADMDTDQRSQLESDLAAAKSKLTR